MSQLPTITQVAPETPAARSGISVGDAIVSINGESPRDIIHYQQLVDTPQLTFELKRGALRRTVTLERDLGTPLGIEIHSAVFDRVRTCDNHCSFCFIYQLPRGMRRSLYVKDDDYRLSFLYGNFTTLTRFTEADLERVITEKLSPLYVSIHATDPELRATLLRNPRGATSLRWLRAMLDFGVTVHGQIVVCPGINDGAVLHDTLNGIYDEYPELETVAVVPLGTSRFTKDPKMRPHTRAEAARDVAIVAQWQEEFLSAFGRRTVYAADEYYLRSGLPFPAAETYGEFSMYEDGIGMARAFESELLGQTDETVGAAAGFFQSVDITPEGYRAPRRDDCVEKHDGTSFGCAALQVTPPSVNSSSALRGNSIALLTGELGAAVLQPHQDVMQELAEVPVEIVAVKNEFFGGNVGVTGLLTHADITRTLSARMAHPNTSHIRYLLPDVCLSGGRFLDDGTPETLPTPVEVIGSNGVALRQALLEHRIRRTAS